MSLIMGGPIFLVTSILGGAFAVFLYSRRTGETLSVINGARLGWISGLFGFLVLSVLVLLVVMQISQPEVATALREQMKKSPVPVSETDVNQMIDFMRSPPGVPAILIFLFLLSTVLPAFGGAVGAKLFRRD